MTEHQRPEPIADDELDAVTGGGDTVRRRGGKGVILSSEGREPSYKVGSDGGFDTQGIVLSSESEEPAYKRDSGKNGVILSSEGAEPS